MNTRTSLVLMIVFMVLGSFAFFDPFGTKEKGELKRDRESHVFWLKDKRVESLSIRRGPEEVLLECTKAEGCPFDPSGDWRMTKPVADLADPANTGAAAGAILNLTQTDKIALENGVDPKEFGFDPPEAEVEIRVKGEAEPYSFKIGTAKLVGGAGAYLLTNRDPKTVYVVGSFFPGMFAKDVFHWRNKRIYPDVTGDEIQAIEWTDKGGAKISAVKEGTDWKLTAPSSVPAANTMLAGLASTLAYLEMKSVFAENAQAPAGKKAVQGKPEWQISYKTSKGADRKFELFPAPADPKKMKEYILRKGGEDRLFLVEGQPIERFNKPLIEFRDRRVLADGELPAATEIALSFPREKKEIVLKPGAQGWEYSAGDKPAEALSRERIDGFFRALASLEADRFLPLKSSNDPAVASFGQRPADLEVEFRVNGQPKRRLRFTLYSRQEVITQARTGNELASVGGAFLRALPVRYVDLYQSNNKQVVTSDPKAEEHGEHSHPEHQH